MAIQETIIEFIKKDLIRDIRNRTLEPEDNLIELGIIDSLGIQKLINFLEESYSVEIGDDELVPENFETVKAIASFMLGKSK